MVATPRGRPDRIESPGTGRRLHRGPAGDWRDDDPRPHGPDLTHFASRRGIAANALPNTTANLAAWITHAQSLKPYAQMPNVTAFDGEELGALTAYLQTLR
jgi:cytochrome c1